MFGESFVVTVVRAVVPGSIIEGLLVRGLPVVAPLPVVVPLAVVPPPPPAVVAPATVGMVTTVPQRVV